MKTSEEIETLTKMIEIIETLTMIEIAELQNITRVNEYKKRLLGYWTKIFDNDKQLQKDIINAQNASEYQGGEDGIYSWYRVKTNLKDYEQCKEYIEEYVSENSCLRIDWENQCFMNWLGDDNIIIQDDTRRNNGVWQGQKCIIPESEYKNDDGEVNTEKRNELIEAYMEKSGYFPGVFRVDYHGNIFHVKTTK